MVLTSRCGIDRIQTVPPDPEHWHELRIIPKSFTYPRERDLRSIVLRTPLCAFRFAVTNDITVKEFRERITKTLLRPETVKEVRLAWFENDVKKTFRDAVSVIAPYAQRELRLELPERRKSISYLRLAG
eukprot:Trichotokara_eunicae@DN5833_c0_g1_i1.p1